MGLLKIGRKSDRPHNKAVPEIEYNFLPLASDVIGISDDAVSRIRDMIEMPNSYLRIALRGGGCSGFSIHYEFTEQRREQDHVFSNQEINVVIDPKSLSFLGGATLHCRDYLGSKEFILVNNPNAKLCSCGKSFSL